MKQSFCKNNPSDFLLNYCMRIQMEYKKAGAKKMKKKIGLLISTLVIGGSFYYRDVGAMMMLVIKRVKVTPQFFFLGRYIGESFDR